MSHPDLMHAIRMLGCRYRRASQKHDLYETPATGRKVTIPRRKEICDELASLIKNYLAEESEPS